MTERLLTGMLAWWDEPPELLRQLILSLAGLVDHLVAADGRWRLTPGQDFLSPLEQHLAIDEACKQAGITLDIHTPGELWDGQVHKRNALLELAPPSKWLLPLDADWTIEGDKEQARALLESQHAEGIEAIFVPFRTAADPTRNLKETSATTWHEIMVDFDAALPLIFRRMHAMRYEVHHHWLTGVRDDGEHIAYDGHLYGGPVRGGLNCITVHHHCHFRDLERIERNRVFCQQRDAELGITGLEA